MYYKVKARLIENAAAVFYRKLTDGTILNQKPDGREIVESLQRAKVDKSGTVRWSEACYCSSPLAHERATVYDHFFSELETAQADDYVPFEGRDFMAYLAGLAG